jgi:hypothetical protein
MWSFFFKTMPAASPTREWAASVAVMALFVVISAIVLPLSPALDPLLRTGIGVCVFYAGALGITALRRRRARILGVPFTHTDAIKKQLFQWLTSQPLIPALGRILLLSVPMFLGAVMLFTGHQIWQFDDFDRRVVLEMLAMTAPLGIITPVVLGFTEWSRRYAGMIGCLVIITLIISVSRVIPHDPSTLGTLLNREWDIASLWVVAAAVLPWRFRRRKS